MQDFDLERIMALDRFPALLAVLPPPKQRSVALALVRSLCESGAAVACPAHVEMLFSFLAPLVQAGAGDVVLVRSPQACLCICP